jgi:hypothetical protein
LLRVCRRKNILARFCHQPPKASRGQVCTTSRFAAPPLEETVAYSPKKAQNRQKCTRRDELGLALSARQVAGPPQQAKAWKGDVVWHGTQPGRVRLKERQLQVTRLRLRRKGCGANKEVSIPACEAMQQESPMTVPATTSNENGRELE